MIMLNMKSSEPIWEQIRDSIKKQILAGALSAGDKLPSVRVLSGELGINPNTIQRAYTELESEGFVYSVVGRGSFVAEKNTSSLEAEKVKRLSLFKKALDEAYEIGIEKAELIEIIEKEYEK